MLDQVRDDSSSLLYLRDPESFRSSVTAATERSSLLELAFDFDRDLATTRVYHRQWRSLIRRTLLMSRKDKGTSSRIENGHSDRPLSIVNSRVEDHLHVVDIRILVAAQPGGPVGALRDVMSILCEGRYDPEVRRGHIYKVLLTTISSTLDEMAKSSQLLGNPEAWTPPQAVLCQQISTSSANISEELGNALVSAWDDPGVKRCYQNSVESTAHPSAT